MPGAHTISVLNVHIFELSYTYSLSPAVPEQLYTCCSLGCGSVFTSHCSHLYAGASIFTTQDPAQPWSSSVKSSPLVQDPLAAVPTLPHHASPVFYDRLYAPARSVVIHSALKCSLLGQALGCRGLSLHLHCITLGQRNGRQS